jgi:hypothetical protein
MNNRWTKEEESNLLKNIQAGKTYAELSGGFNRSENALEMRVKKIVYENITAGKTPSKISELLNMKSDKVMQYYYSYKEHLERETKQNGGNLPNDNNINIIQNDKIEKMDKIDKIDKISKLDINKNTQLNTQSNTQYGGNKLEKLKYQNEKMKLLIENYMLKHKLSKYMKTSNNIQNDILKALLDK